jgi:hypothetical protein
MRSASPLRVSVPQASGNGTRCSGKMVTVGTYENAVVRIDTKLARIGPEVPVQVKADRMAALIAALCDRDQSMIRRFLLLIEPFTYSLIFEVCALVSFSYGFSHRREPSKATVEPRQTATNGWHHHQLNHGTVTVHSDSNIEQSIEPEPINRSTVGRLNLLHRRTLPSHHRTVPSAGHSPRRRH